jgi:hypothetical protein
MSHGKTITTFLMDGSLKGPREVQSESIFLYILPREIASKVSDISVPGFYILTGKEKIYIGQSKDCKQRLVSHSKNISWWDTAFVIVSKLKEEFDATTIQYLEAKCIEDVVSIGNAVNCDNQVTPKVPSLPKYQEAKIKSIYEEAKMLLEFAGCGVFVKAEIQEGDIYYINAPMKGVAAKGIYYPETHKVVVLTGSTVDPKFANSYRNKEARAKLMAEITQTDKNGMPVTTKDHTFDSPSAAAKFVLGRPANGLDEWKDKEGKSLNDLKK